MPPMPSGADLQTKATVTFSEFSAPRREVEFFSWTVMRVSRLVPQRCGGGWIRDG
jgi:hypothetical protein